MDVSALTLTILEKIADKNASPEMSGTKHTMTVVVSIVTVLIPPASSAINPIARDAAQRRGGIEVITGKIYRISPSTHAAPRRDARILAAKPNEFPQNSIQNMAPTVKIIRVRKVVATIDVQNAAESDTTTTRVGEANMFQIPGVIVQG